MALVSVASVASQSSLAQLECGRIVGVARARLLDRLLFIVAIFAGSLPSSGALRATFALAKPTRKTRCVTSSLSSAWRWQESEPSPPKPKKRKLDPPLFLSCCVRPSFFWAYGFPSGRAAVHQRCVALVSVASVASQSSPAQLEWGRIVGVARARLLDRLLFIVAIFAGSLPSSGALGVAFALAKPTHKASCVTKCPVQPGDGIACGPLQLIGFPFERASVHRAFGATVHSQPSQRGPIAQAWGRVRPSFDSTNAGPGLMISEHAASHQHSIVPMRFPELLRDPGVPSLRHSKLPVCPKNQTGGVSSQISLPGVRRPSPTAPYILILAGAARVVDKATNLVKAVAASYLGMEPVEELLMFGQMPSVLFCRAVLQLPTWQAAWDTSTQVLDLLLVGHSHGGLMAHDVAQRLESTGFAVRGVMALDTLHVPRWTGDAEMEPKALLKNRAPDHWQLLSLEVNMMAMRTAAPRTQSGLFFSVFWGFRLWMGMS